MRNQTLPTGARAYRVVTTGVALALCVVASAASVLVAPASSSAAAKSKVIVAVGAENEYANVLSQIGGQYVKVSAILADPSTDPHTYEASPSVAQEIARAQLIVQNGVGYDGFMNKIEAASPNSSRTVIVAQKVLHLRAETANPHLWYSPPTMPAVAAVIARDLSHIDPAHAAYFQRNLRSFNASLQPWLHAIAAFKSAHAGLKVAVTEPVADYLLKAMGVRILTPFVFQADVMNGVDPSPEDIALEEGYLSKHEAKVFCYNQQVVDSLTLTIRQMAITDKVPVVGVYETMPTGYDYQTWMLAEVTAINAAITRHHSTEKL
jgi:zinc/manganese transport system substrate-binding protein